MLVVSESYQHFYTVTVNQMNYDRGGTGYRDIQYILHSTVHTFCTVQYLPFLFVTSTCFPKISVQLANSPRVTLGNGPQSTKHL
jgi:hypothetical protein